MCIDIMIFLLKGEGILPGGCGMTLAIILKYNTDLISPVDSPAPVINHLNES